MNIEELNAKFKELQAFKNEKQQAYFAADNELSTFADAAAKEISPIKVGDFVREYWTDQLDGQNKYKPGIYKVSKVQWCGYGDLGRIVIYGRKILKNGRFLHNDEIRLYGDLEKVS